MYMLVWILGMHQTVPLEAFPLAESHWESAIAVYPMTSMGKTAGRCHLTLVQ